jgi:hypothetical protein
MSALRLEIGRLEVQCLVGRDHPDAPGVQARLAPLATRLSGALGEALSGLEASASGEVWLLRRVEAEATLDTTAEPILVARRWAAALAGAIARRLDPAAEGVVRFPDRTAYLARFLADLARGHAWSAWYYRSFEGLRVLPAATALRTAILAEPASGREALLLLGRWERDRVVDALGAAEAARVLEGLAEAGAPDDPLPAPPALLAAAAASGGAVPGCPARQALHLFLLLAAHAPQGAPPVGSAAAAVARALARLPGLVLSRDAAVLRAICGGDVAALYRAAGPEASEVLLPLLRLPPALRAALSDAVADPAAGAPAPVRDTPFGGLFLLLRDLEDVLPDPTGWPAPKGCRPDAVLRLLVLAACAGPRRSASAWRDPIWRDLLGLPGHFGPEALAIWTAGLPRAALTAWRGQLPPMPRPQRPHIAFAELPPRLRLCLACAAGLLLARFCGRLPGFGGSSPPYLWRNFLDLYARVESAGAIIRVELTRPPLDAVLAMTGALRQRLAPAWLEARTIELRPERLQ